MNPITEAIEYDSVAKMKSLIRNGTNLNSPICVGEEYDLEEYDEISPLFYAIRKYASVEMLVLFIENGVDLMQTDSEGISALDMAIKFRHKDAIQFCIDNGFDLNTTKRKSGITPVLLAACFSDIEMMQMLLDAGGEIDTVDKAGMSAKDYAKKLGQKKMLEFLEAKGAKFSLYANQ
ncbi:ankyrin repeat family protein [hydrothermal vent metagenome]|uniref:Ankyrin repeat family protein n=1 Tax=hydrothermal vent metagenome TaxID=652676 RepID=A0A1W1C0G1_9ZZZZ